MAEANSTIKWHLLEKLPAGPIKDNLIEIKNQLLGITEANDILLTLAKWKQACEEDTLTLAVDTVFDICCQIDLKPDAVFYHLNQIFEPQVEKPKAAGREGQDTSSIKAEVIEKLITILANKDNVPPELLAALKSRIDEAHRRVFGEETPAPTPKPKEAHATLSIDQVNKIDIKMSELSTLMSVLVAAGEGNSTFDTEGFAYMMEEKFEELYNAYHEAIGDESRYEPYQTK